MDPERCKGSDCVSMTKGLKCKVHQIDLCSGARVKDGRPDTAWQQWLFKCNRG